MSVVHRRILTTFFFLVFFIAAPLTILYAAGYRYNTRLHKIEQVGLLYVTAKQSNAKLTVGEQTFNVNGELVVNSLQPQSYQMTLSKEGYHPWSKNLEIFEGKATFILDVRLFADAQPQPFELYDNALDFLAEDISLAVYRTSDYLILYQKDSKKIHEFPLPSTAALDHLRLDGASGHISFHQEQTWYVADLNGLRGINALLPAGTTEVLAVDGQIFALTTDHIWTIDTTGGQSEDLVAQALPEDILRIGDRAWIIAAAANHKHSFLYEAASASSRPTFLTALPYSDDLVIADQNHGLLTIDDRANHQVHLVDTQTTPALVTTLPGVHAWAWSRNHDQLLTATDFEVTIQHIDHGVSQELIARLSTPITDVAWEQSEQHVFFVSNDVIHVAERDNRDTRNITDLTTAHGQTHLLQVANDDASLQFSGQQGKAFVFWDLPL